MLKYNAFSIAGFMADQALTVQYMILDGFLERHPKIKIILTHLGGSLPYWYRRLNFVSEVATSPPESTGRANLTKPASEYLKHFYYDTALGNTDALEFLKKLLGSADRILFGSDHPYVELAEAKTIDYITRSSLTGEEKDKVFSGNAKKLFGV